MQNVTQPMGIALILIAVRTSDEKTVSDKHRYFYILLVSFFLTITSKLGKPGGNIETNLDRIYSSEFLIWNDIWFIGRAEGKRSGQKKKIQDQTAWILVLSGWTFRRLRIWQTHLLKTSIGLFVQTKLDKQAFSNWLLITDVDIAWYFAQHILSHYVFSDMFSVIKSCQSRHKTPDLKMYFMWPFMFRFALNPPLLFIHTLHHFWRSAKCGKHDHYISSKQEKSEWKGYKW